MAGKIADLAYYNSVFSHTHILILTLTHTRSLCFSHQAKTHLFGAKRVVFANVEDDRVLEGEMVQNWATEVQQVEPNN